MVRPDERARAEHTVGGKVERPKEKAGEGDERERRKERGSNSPQPLDSSIAEIFHASPFSLRSSPRAFRAALCSCATVETGTDRGS